MASQTITFNKENNQYVATFQATGDFAIHLERNELGPVTIGASTVQNAGYALVDDFPTSAGNKPVIDYDFSGLVYPKYIKVISATEPTMAVVTFAE